MANKLQLTDVFVDGEQLDDTKMSTLVEGINNALAMFSGVLADFGGDDRVVDDPDSSTELEVTESSPADMNVNIATGYGVVSGMVIQNEAAALLTIVSPTVSNRYTIVQISNDGVLSTKNSAEQGSPVEPSADADNIKLCAIYLPQNAPHINDEGGAAGGDGEIFDRREPMAYHPTTITRQLSLYIPGVVGTATGPNSDGYFLGKVASGMTFGVPITINKVEIQAYDPPTGAAIVLTFRNITQVTSDTVTLADGEYFAADATIDLDFAAADEMAIQVTTVGSSNAGGYLSLVIQYQLQ